MLWSGTCYPLTLALWEEHSAFFSMDSSWLRLKALLDHKPAPDWFCPSGHTYLQWLLSPANHRRC